MASRTIYSNTQIVRYGMKVNKMQWDRDRKRMPVILDSPIGKWEDRIKQ